MKILLTGSTGYIGKRLLPLLINNGHQVVCCVRDKSRFNPPTSLLDNITLIEVDLLNEDSLKKIPNNIDGAYYLVHSMSISKDYDLLEKKCAINFCNALTNTNVKQVIYLSGIVNEDKLSKHLQSRKNVEIELSKGKYHLTTLRAGIIIGSGSASFEIIRDLAEKLPIMIAPKWLKTKCQPISVSDVLKYLSNSIFNEKTYSESFDIGGPDILSYKQMLLRFAEARNLKRKIYSVPVMTPSLSSYWLYFVTSTSYRLAVALVNSMKVEVTCKDSSINEILGIDPISYEDSLHSALDKIDNNAIISSWKDSFVSGNFDLTLSEFIAVPQYGCFKDERTRVSSDINQTIKKIWKIGGDNGWYATNFLWRLRGILDKLFGGVGLRRGRTNQTSLNVGDALDFWRVLYADKLEGRLLLFAEMKLPGEAWLEFKILDNKLSQTATFRPKGILGRVYWFSVYPFHNIVFSGLIKKLTDHYKD